MTQQTVPQQPASTGYVPVDEWPDVTTMLDGFGDPSLLPSRGLEGIAIDARTSDGPVHYSFDEGAVTRSRGGESDVSHPYRAVEVRPGLFFVDWVEGVGAHAADVSLVIDTAAGRILEARSTFVDRSGSVRMNTSITQGAFGEAGPGEHFAPSTELVGKRIYYRYSPTEHYEHVYLNAGTFVWHCVRGGEVGLADADPVRMWSLGDGLVALHWSETVMPVESLVVIDLQQRRSIGRMFCWDGPTLADVHIPFDSEFTVLGEIAYPER